MRKVAPPCTPAFPGFSPENRGQSQPRETLDLPGSGVCQPGAEEAQPPLAIEAEAPGVARRGAGARIRPRERVEDYTKSDKAKESRGAGAPRTEASGGETEDSGAAGGRASIEGANVPRAGNAVSILRPPISRSAGAPRRSLAYFYSSLSERRVLGSSPFPLEEFARPRARPPRLPPPATRRQQHANIPLFAIRMPQNAAARAGRGAVSAGCDPRPRGAPHSYSFCRRLGGKKRGPAEEVDEGDAAAVYTYSIRESRDKLHFGMKRIYTPGGCTGAS